MSRPSTRWVPRPRSSGGPPRHAAEPPGPPPGRPSPGLPPGRPSPGLPPGRPSPGPPPGRPSPGPPPGRPSPGPAPVRAAGADTGTAAGAGTPEPAGVRGARSDAGLLRTTGSLALPTLISRITGFVKVIALASVIGLSGVTSAFNLANTLPNIIAELVLGAVLTSIVIPVLVRAEREDADGGTEFVRRLFTMAGMILVVATVLAVLGAPLLTDLYTEDDTTLDLRLITCLAVLLLPQIMFYGFSALSGAVLNTRGVFGLVAWAPVLNNVVAIGTLVVYALTPGELVASLTNPRLLVLGIGTTLGIVVQAVVVIPTLRAKGIDLRPLWGLDPRLKRFLGLGAAVIAYVLVSQVGLTITFRVAGAVRESDVVIYNNAWLLLQVPYGVLGVSLLTAIMPRMSRAAAAGDDRAVLDDLSLGSRLSVVALMPVVVLFTFRGTVLGTALFSWGAAAEGPNAARLGATVAASAFGLIPYAVVLLQLRVFYARQQAWVPTLVMAVMVAVKVPLLYLAPVVLPTDDVVLGLAAINGACFAVGAVFGAVLLRRALGPLGLGSLGRTTVVVLGAGLVGALLDAGFSAVVPLGALTANHGALGAVAEFTVHAVLMLGVTITLALWFGLPELATVRLAGSRLTDRFRRSSPAPVGADTRGDPLGAHSRRSTGVVPYPGVGAGGVSAGVRGGAGGDGVTGDVDLRGEDLRGEDERADPPPTEAVPVAAPPRPFARAPRLVPGAAVVGGRYRLLAEHGGVGAMHFWQAKDTTLDRDVALTFVDSAETGFPAAVSPAMEDPAEVLRRTRRLGGISVPGLARVLDVVQGGSGAVVVAEWTPGRSLADVANSNPSAVGAARAVRTLAEAAEAAHRNGTVLGIDHPDRLRISYTGAAVLAFPGVSAAADVRADVAGLGAALYALITAHWPLGNPDDAFVGGLPHAPRTEAGTVVEPRALSAAVPYEISAVTLRALSPDGGLRTAAAVETVLEQAAVLDQQTDMFPAISDGYYTDPYADPTQTQAQAPPAPPERPARAAGAARVDRRPVRDDDGGLLGRRSKLALGIGALVAVLALVAVFTLRQLTGAFGGGGEEAALPALRLNPDGSVITDAPAPDADPNAPAPAEPAPAPAAPIRIAGTTVYSPGGEPDRPQDVGLAFDGDPATVWATDNYRQPMGALKRGVGIMIALEGPSPLTSVRIESPSPDTVVEIRTSPGENPPLEETSVVGTATLPAGVTEIPVQVTEATPFVLVWLTGLSTAGGGNQSEIAEIALTS